MILEIYADNLKKADKSPHISQSARAIIKNQDHVLLLYSKKLDYYMLPGGRIEKNEAPETCVLRELKEETGYHAKILSKTLMIKEYFDDSTWESHFFLCDLTKAQAGSKSLTQAEHYLELEPVWMHYLDALDILDSHYSSFSKAMNIMHREFLALSNSL